MAIISTKHTKETMNKLVNDLRRYLFIFTIVLNVFLIGYYTYSLIKNLNHTFLIPVNALILAAAVFSFFIYIVPVIKTKKTRRYVKDTIKYTKVGLCLASIIYNFVIHFIYQMNKVHLTLTILSLVLLIIQILFYLVVKFVERYTKEFAVAIQEDYAESNFIGKKILDKTFVSKIVSKEEKENE